MTKDQIQIDLCTGLFGVCVIGTLGDDYDQVFHHIEVIGVQEWYDQLPEYDKPEGPHTLIVEIDDDTGAYTIVEVKEYQP